MNSEQAFLDIYNGYSVLEGETTVYVKHYGVFDSIRYSALHKKKLDYYANYGKRKESDLFKELMSQGKWLPIQEKSIKSFDIELGMMESKKRQITDYYQIHGIYDAMQEITQSKIDALTQKYSLIDDSVEISANKAIREQQIIDTCFYDIEFKNPVWTQETFEYDTSRQFYDIQNRYHATLDGFSIESLKNLCVQDFVLNIVGLLETYSTLFGVSPLGLTQNQLLFSRLASTYVKVAIEEPCDDDNVAGIAEKVLMWYYWKKNGGEKTNDKADRDNIAKLNEIANKRV